MAKDDLQARRWFGLGIMHRDGQGGPQDYVEARRWFGLAADQGDAKAQRNLAKMLERGLGGPRDTASAQRLYGLMAQGDEDAQELLSESLMEAVWDGDAKALALRLDAGGKVGTALHAAAEGGQLNMVELLLNARANINHADEEGETPLMSAAKAGELEVAKLLCTRGATRTGREVELALEEGHMLTAAWFTTSMTLMDAVWAGNAEVLAMRLKEEGGQVDWNARRGGQTPLTHAIDFERPALVELLLSAGADANAANDNGWRPLHFAVANNYTAIVKLLLTRRVICLHSIACTLSHYHAAADAGGWPSFTCRLHVNEKDGDGCTAGTCTREY